MNIICWTHRTHILKIILISIFKDSKRWNTHRIEKGLLKCLPLLLIEFTLARFVIISNSSKSPAPLLGLECSVFVAGDQGSCTDDMCVVEADVRGFGEIARHGFNAGSVKQNKSVQHKYARKCKYYFGSSWYLRFKRM